MTNELDSDGNGNKNAKVNVPPPEAFQKSDELQFPRPPQQSRVKNNNKNDNVQASSREDGIMPNENSTMIPPRRPSLLIKRQSSLFSQLPVRSKSRLFDPVDNNKIAAETAMTNFSQSTWLQEEHQSTLLGGDGSSQLLPFDESQITDYSSVRRPQQEKSSLFGAVMRKFSSSISGPSSPFSLGSKRTRESSFSRNDDTTTGGGGAVSNLLMSPSGKSIMNIVNRFNSPFKFQSPQGLKSNDKKRHGRRLWGDDDETEKKEVDDDAATFTTPTSSSRKKKRQRRRFEQLADDEDDGSNIQRSNILFPDQDDSRSSLYGNETGGDHHWREAPIVDVGSRKSNIGATTTKTRMEILDWSLPTKVRMEVHGVTTISPVSSSSSGQLQLLKQYERRRQQPILDTSWVRELLRDNEEVLTYWEYRSILPTNSDGAGGGIIASTGAQSSGLLRRNSTANGRQQKIIGKKTFNRKKSLNGISSNEELKIASLKQSGSIMAASGVEKNITANTADLAKYLIQSVRGPRAKYSRKRVMEEDWEQTILTAPDNNKERSQRQWQHSIRSLFSNYHQCLKLLVSEEDSPCSTIKSVVSSKYHESTNDIILDSYFYCIGHDHSVLFRVAMSDADENGNDKRGHTIAVVLVSSTSDSFRKQLEVHGMDMNKESFQFLESIEEREVRIKSKIATAAVAAKKSRTTKAANKSFLSPGVKADLEALRRAQAFGESAGADITVKVKKPIQLQDNEEKQKLSKAVRISGWDNVSLFFEVYLNQYGDVNNNYANGGIDKKGTSTISNRTLPLLICRNGLGPFEHASMKRLRLFPVEKEKSEPDNNEKEVATSGSNTIDICGILLPCAIRKLLLVARKRILEDEVQQQREQQQSSISVSDKSDSIHGGKKEIVSPKDSSRYVVLNSMRPSKPLSQSLMVGFNGSLVFNQGKKKKSLDSNYHNGSIFECPNGKVVSMAVWDTSREEVAACKMDDAFTDNWFKK